MLNRPTGDAAGMSQSQTHAHLSGMEGRAKQSQAVHSSVNAGLPGWKGAVQQIGASSGLDVNESDIHGALGAMAQTGAIHPMVAQGVAHHNGPLQGPMGGQVVKAVVQHIAAKKGGGMGPMGGPQGAPPGAPQPPQAPQGPVAPQAPQAPQGPALPPAAMAAMARARAGGMR